MENWSEKVLDLLDDIYPNLDLRNAALKDIEAAIQAEKEPKQRQRFLQWYHYHPHRDP